MALGLDPGGRARFAKILMAIIDELTQVYRDLLQQHVPSSQIFNKVKASPVFFKNLHNDKLLILRDANAKGYKDLDMTMLYTLLRNICTSIPPPTKGWGTHEFPETGEIGIGDDIERIRLIRNKMYGHVNSTSISKQLFEDYWKMISDICQRLQSQIGGSYTNNLQNILEMTIEEEQENQYIEKLKAENEKEKSMLEKMSSIQSDVRDLKSSLRSSFFKIRRYRSTVKVNVQPKINSSKTKQKVDRSMDILKKALNRMVEFIDEETEEEEISVIENGITEFLESSSRKTDIIFINKLLETMQNNIESAFEQRKKARMAIMRRFVSFVIFVRKKYKAKFKVDDGSLLITFYFESLQGFEKFTEDLKNGIIQEEVKKVVQYNLFLWIFRLKKDDVIVELEECTDIENDDVEIEETRKLAKSCTECHKMRYTTCPVCEFGFCEKCWTTHCHVHAFEKIEQQPASAFPARCSIHEHNTNTTFCKTCNTYLCELCPTESHSVHDVIHLKYQPVEAEIKAGTKGVHVAITDIYESIYSNMTRKRKELPKQYELLKDKIKLEGKKLHEKVDDAVKMQINILEDMQNKHLNALENSIQKMKDASDDVSKMIASYEEVLKKGSVEDIIYFETNMESLKIIPEWSDFTFPVFKPRDVEEEVVFEWMGDLIPGVPQEIQELNLYPQTLELPIRKVKQLIENPIVSQKLLTGLSGMRSLVVDLEEKIWTSGYNDDTPSLFVLPMIKEGVKPTKLETFPMDRFIFDMCFNFEGDLVFSDSAEGSVDIWKDDQVIELVRLQDWTPMGVYATTEDILVCMIHTSTCCKKIVRHREGYIEHFEFDQDGEPLFSDEDETLYIAMNPNSDLCVSDYGANKVLVLNKWGLLRFTYTGETTFLDSEPFGPRGITTDAMSRILIADCNNHCVHILDHTGKCLSLIENNDMRVPWTLDTIDDKVVVGNYNEGSILVLKYLE